MLTTSAYLPTPSELEDSLRWRIMPVRGGEGTATGLVVVMSSGFDGEPRGPSMVSMTVEPDETESEERAICKLSAIQSPPPLDSKQ